MLRVLGACLLLISGSSLLIAQSFEKPNLILLDNAKIVVRPGEVMESGDLLIRNGVIAEVAQQITAPENAQVVDCKGLTLYPGFIHPMLAAPSADIEKQLPANPARRLADPMNAAGNLATRLRTVDFEFTTPALLMNLSKSGYCVAHVYTPAGLVGPQSAVLSCASDRKSGLVYESSFGVPVAIQNANARGLYPSSIMGAIAFIRQAFYDAQWQSRLTRRYEANPTGLPRPAQDESLAQLDSVLRRDRPALFDNLSDLSALQAVAICDEFKLLPVLRFRSGAGALLDLLAKGNHTVLLSGEVPPKPSLWDKNEFNLLSSVRNYFNELQSGKAVEGAGLKFSYSPSGSDPLAGIRAYVRSGLSKTAALEAMTTRPAELLGISRKTGTLEKGKLANVVVVQGDIFASSSQIIATFVDGRKVDMPEPQRKKPEELVDDAPEKLMKPNFDFFPRPAETAPAFRLYKNATVWTMGSQGVLTNADVLIRDGKIAAVGRNVSPPSGCEVIDATGKHITPGIWDCHSHTAIDGNVNEFTNMVTIECRIKDVIDHRDVNVYHQLAGGTVGAQQLHGSANVIGGQTSTSKWRWGMSPTDYPVAGAPEGVKFALGENPIEEDEGGFRQPSTQPPSERPRTRMGIDRWVRETFDKAKRYKQEWVAFKSGETRDEPRRILQMDALVELLEGTRLVHSHGYRQDEFLTLIRTCQEYGVKIATFQHVLEGYKIADEMAAAGIGGSTFSDWWGYKLEAYDAIPHNMALMYARGVSVSVNSDSDDHARRLNLEAAKAMRYGGVDPQVALSFVTTEPAKQLRIFNRTGSLEVGKDADVAIWSGDPLSTYTVCLATYVDGVKRFDIENDMEQRKERAQELEEARKILGETKTAEPTIGAKASVRKATIEGQAGVAKYPKTPVLIVGAVVHPVVSEPFVGDVLIGANGKIEQVGKVTPPKNVTRVDAKGLHLYPGLIDAWTTLGLTEIGQVPVSVDTSERGDFNPDLRPERALNPDSETLFVARNQGVLTALIRPTGQFLPGQAALITLDGYTWEDFRIQGSLGVVCDVGGGPRVEPQASQQLKSQLERLGKLLDEAREYARLRSGAGAAGVIVEANEKFETLAKVARGELPVFFIVQSGAAISETLKWADEKGIEARLVGCGGAPEIAAQLSARGEAVIFGSVYGVPPAERPYDDFYSAPARMRAGGLKFCLTTGDAHNVRQLRDIAGMAARHGLVKEDALKAITLWPAEILGIAHRLGSIRPGMEATLFLATGDILEVRTQVTRAWILGREISLETRQTRLYEKYRARPKGVGSRAGATVP